MTLKLEEGMVPDASILSDDITTIVKGLQKKVREHNANTSAIELVTFVLTPEPFPSDPNTVVKATRVTLQDMPNGESPRMGVAPWLHASHYEGRKFFQIRPVVILSLNPSGGVHASFRFEYVSSNNVDVRWNCEVDYDHLSKDESYLQANAVVWFHTKQPLAKVAAEQIFAFLRWQEKPNNTARPMTEREKKDYSLCGVLCERLTDMTSSLYLHMPSLAKETTLLDEKAHKCWGTANVPGLLKVFEEYYKLVKNCTN